eukprot:6371474-Amphidinium_carterae.3
MAPLLALVRRLPAHLASRSGDDCECGDVRMPVKTLCCMDVPAVGEQELKRRLGEAEKVEDELATSWRARKRMQRVRR